MRSTAISILLKKYSISEKIINDFNNVRVLKNSNLTDILLIINSIYYSSSIEYEDELTIQDTKIIINDYAKKNGRVKKNKNKERSEKIVTNAFNAYKIFENITNVKSITSATIREFHYYLMNGIDKVDAGQYREFYCTIAGREDVVSFTSPDNIEKEMELFITDLQYLDEKLEYKSNEEKLNEILDIKRRFIRIHPFEDGNGRTSRALFQLLLKLFKLPMCTFRGWKRKDYHNGMHIAYITKSSMTIVKSMYLTEIFSDFAKYYTMNENEYDLDVALGLKEENNIDDFDWSI